MNSDRRHQVVPECKHVPRRLSERRLDENKLTASQNQQCGKKSFAEAFVADHPSNIYYSRLCMPNNLMLEFPVPAAAASLSANYKDGSSRDAGAPSLNLNPCFSIITSIGKRMPDQFLACKLFTLPWTRIACWLVAILLFQNNQAGADGLAIDEIPLPPLRIDSQPARAHTQGLEVTGSSYYVTARREDIRPKRAMLLRTGKTETHWDVWDITPRDSGSAPMTLDHPGGMQSDGQRLWIPIAESKPKSRSIIRVVPLAAMVAGQPLDPEFEFPVDDHIGAVAVAVDHNLVLGANWDTESVYVWDLHGHLKRTLTGSELGLRGLGAVAGPTPRFGIAVQDWKLIGDRLFA